MNIDELLSKYAAGERDFGAINLRQANLTGIFLKEANLGGTCLHLANLTNTDLSEARLRGSQNIQPDQLNKAILTGTEMPDGKIQP
ncbi:pentapeptide repeat-containing protein [Allocoleopsis sp.]|uniref:pentapeptide repeat-containing protein n=1 Tax=Allocoleopsis sp. TaxID=3088169 RepID=UPI002FD73532